MKDQRLVRHHAECGHDGLRGLGQLHHPFVRAGRWLATVLSAGDEQQRGVGAELGGAGDGQPVLPLCAIDFLWRPPGLRGHIDDIGRQAGQLVCRDDLPPIAGIRLSDVLIQCRFLLGDDPRAFRPEQGQQQGGEEMMSVVPRQCGGAIHERHYHVIQGDELKNRWHRASLGQPWRQGPGRSAGNIKFPGMVRLAAATGNDLGPGSYEPLGGCRSPGFQFALNCLLENR